MAHVVAEVVHSVRVARAEGLREADEPDREDAAEQERRAGCCAPGVGGHALAAVDARWQDVLPAAVLLLPCCCGQLAFDNAARAEIEEGQR